MKRKIIAILLCIALGMTLTACRSSGAAADDPMLLIPVEQPKIKHTKTVSTVDELLDAIAPNTEIVLYAGDYALQEASDYGAEGSEYYSWETDMNGGYALSLTGVNDLTIHGSGREATSILTASRYADVLRLTDCTNIRLEGFTAGHTEEPEAYSCVGNVLVLQDSAHISMHDLGLFGCGVIGLVAENTGAMELTDSSIYDCSHSAIKLNDASGLVVERCLFYDIGTAEVNGTAIFDMTKTGAVKITDCEIAENYVVNLLNLLGSGKLEIGNTDFIKNTVFDTVFYLYQDPRFVEEELPLEMTLHGNSFDSNEVIRWYTECPDESGIFAEKRAVDLNGTEILPDALNDANKGSVVTASTANTDLNQVHAATVDEFLGAIAPNTEIILDSTLYDLSTATGYGQTDGDYYYWNEAFDGPELVISEVDNLIIRGSGKDSTTISAMPRYANVLSFSACNNVALYDFTAGHTKEQGSCTGGVLFFRSCKNSSVEGCGLFGCGTLGVWAYTSDGLTVSNCDIYECSLGGVELNDCSNIAINSTTLRDLGGADLIIRNCTGLTVDGEALNGVSYRGGADIGTFKLTFAGMEARDITIDSSEVIDLRTLNGSVGVPVTYTSSNEDVLTVSGDLVKATVTPTGVGTATVTAVCGDSTFTTTITVTQ